jgi:hypothetical protein
MLFRRLIALRAGLSQGRSQSFRFRESPPQTVVIERTHHAIAVNLGNKSAPVRRPGDLVLEAARGDGADASRLPPHGAWISLR